MPKAKKNTHNLTAQACAISFKGNARNKLQQDAFYFNDKCYQVVNGISKVFEYHEEFCVAVADGMAVSRHSQHASLACVQAVKKEWQCCITDTNKAFSMANIYHDVANAPKKYHGAMTTLALLYRNQDHKIFIKHIGDTRVYLYSPTTDTHCSNQSNWRCLTRDHNLLNELIDEQAQLTGKTVNPDDYNKTGMASSLYSITEGLMIDTNLYDNPMPRHESQTLSVQAGDCLLICSDGVHDLVSAENWQNINEQTNLCDWLHALKKQVYASTGRAYDNATAVLIRFE